MRDVSVSLEAGFAGLREEYRRTHRQRRQDAARPSRLRLRLGRSCTSRAVENKRPCSPVYSMRSRRDFLRTRKRRRPIVNDLPRASLQIEMSLTKERTDETLACCIGSWF